MRTNRRKHERKIPEKLAFCQLDRDDGGAILNISEGGLAFESFAPLPRKQSVQFWFSLDMRNRVEATGRIAWIDAARMSGGMQFLHLDPQGNEHLLSWIGKLGRGAKRKRKKWPLVAPTFHIHTRPEPSVASDLRDPTDAAADAPSGESEQLGASARSDLPGLPAPSVDKALNALHLVPMEQFRAATRGYFFKGALVGVLISCALGSAFFFGYARARGHRAVAQTTSDTSAALWPQNSPPPAIPLPANNGARSSVLPFTDYPGVTKPPGRLRRVPMTDRDLVLESLQHKRAALGSATADAPTRVRSQTSQSAAASQAPQTSAERALLEAGVPASARPQPGGAMAPRSGSASGASPKSPPTPDQLWSAVQGGDTSAAVTLAGRYIRGEGVAANCDQARALLQAASERKNPQAAKMLGDLDRTGCPTHSE